MRAKRFLSMAMASALMAAQLVTPVAAENTGEVNVDVTTKNAVIQVKVPTKLTVAVDQFETEGDGTQIYSEEFKIDNHSEIPVKVSVNSTVTMKSGITLLEKKSAAQKCTSDNYAWLAVAAQTAADSYDDAATTSAETIASVSEANANVTVVKQLASDQTSGTADQIFYLEKGKDTVVYKMLSSNQTQDYIDGLTYSQFYKLKKETVSSNAALEKLSKEKDLYEGPSVSENEQELTLIKKGRGSVSKNGCVYYSASETSSKPSANDSNLYVYGGTKTVADANGKAAFRYIGKLSESAQEWSRSDISKVTIKYIIAGATSSKYDEVKDSCTYGLYKEVTDKAPSVETKTANYDRTTTLEITTDLGLGTKAASKISSVGGANTKTSTISDFTASCTITGNKITLKAGMFSGASKNDKRYLKITFDDSAQTSDWVELTIIQ